MEALAHRPFITVEEYLEGELASAVRHEYIGGAVHAMAGASREHNYLSLNLATLLNNHLEPSSPCSVFIHDFKVRLLIHEEHIFYYPDVVVTCDPRDTERYYLRFPKLIIEVLSETTEATDRREKLLAYRTIPTLEEYVLVAQDRVDVTLHRRADGWQPACFMALTESVRLESVGLSLTVAEIYRRVFA